MKRAGEGEENPGLRPERSWEGTELSLRNVLVDEQDRVFKMWYAGRVMKAKQGENEIVVLGEHADPAPVDGALVRAAAEHGERPGRDGRGDEIDHRGERVREHRAYGEGDELLPGAQHHPQDDREHRHP